MKDYCIRGHELNENNTLITVGKTGRCKECNREYARERAYRLYHEDENYRKNVLDRLKKSGNKYKKKYFETHPEKKAKENQSKRIRKLRKEFGDNFENVAPPNLLPKRNSKSLEERFWSKVDKNQPNGCWKWVGPLGKDGYGRLKVNKKALAAHRLAYTLSKGVIGEGLSVCHSCDNPPCVNPNHLWLGTHKDNMDDMIGKGRAGFQKKRNINNGH